MEAKLGTEEQKEAEGAVAPDSPQEQPGLVVVVGGQPIIIAEPTVQDFIWIDVITGGTSAGVLDRAKAKSDLIDILISRSALIPEQLAFLNMDPLLSKRLIGSELMQFIFRKTQ